MGVLGFFFLTGTYAGIGTTCVEFENVMKSAMKKKNTLGLDFLQILKM